MERFTIAVCGGSSCSQVESAIAFQCGWKVGETRRYDLVHGTGPGFPSSFVSGFVNSQMNGKTQSSVHGYSPWSSREWHLEKGFRLSDKGTVEFSGLGMARNALLVQAAQTGIFFRGDRGTMVEMLCASKLGRFLLVQRSGPAAELIVNVVTALGGTEEEVARILFFETPEELVEKLTGLNLASVRQLEW